jgi:hypothetical protein
MSLDFEQFSIESHKTLDSILDLSSNTQYQKYSPSDLSSFESLPIYDPVDLSPQLQKSLKCMLIGINQKLKVYDHLCSQLNKSKQEVIEEQSKNEKMRQEFTKTCRSFLLNKEKMQNEINFRVEQNKNLTLRLQNQEKFEEVFEDFKKAKENEICALRLQIQQMKNMEVVEFQKKVDDNCGKVEGNGISDGFEKILEEYQQNFQNLTKENDDLRLKILTLQKKNLELTTDLNELKHEVIFLTTSMISSETQSHYVEELESQLQKLKNDLKKSQESITSLQIELKTASNYYESSLKSLFAEKSSLISHNKQLCEDYSHLKADLISLQNNYLELQSKSYNNSHVNTLSFTLLTEQNLKLLQDSKDFCELANKLEEKIIHENQLMSSGFLDIAENYLMIQRLLGKVLLYLKDKDLENVLMRESLDRLQRLKVVYVPIRNDYIDNQLASFINSSPFPIEVPFIRISSGVYLFGTKRVVLKAENSEISIRVGGGFIKLDDFIYNQTPFEIGKIKERELKAHRSIPSSPIYTSPEPSKIDRIGSPKFLNSPKLAVQKSPKGPSDKKKPPVSSKLIRKNTIV